MTFSHSRLVLAALGVATALTLSPTAPAAARGELEAALFPRLDANGDGRIDARELELARRKRFGRLDANGDGVVTQAEIDRAIERIHRRSLFVTLLMANRFDRMDKNGDLSVSKDEFLTDSPSLLHALADTDGDGIITREEFGRAIAAFRAWRNARQPLLPPQPLKE